MKNTVSNQQSYNIQILRGAAIISVVLIHNVPSAATAQILIRPFINYGVAVFLFLSGFLSSADEWNPKKRIKKVFIPYLIWTLIYVIIHNIDQLNEIPLEYIKNVLNGQAAAPLYYAFVYCGFTLLIPLIDKLAKSKYKYIGFLISPLEIIIFRLFPLMLGIEIHPLIKNVISISCFGWFTYFYLGYLIGNDLIEIKVSRVKLNLLLAISLLLQIIEGYLYYLMGEANCGTQLKLSAILSGSIFCLLSYLFINDNNHKIHFLKILGDYSSGIYFSHIAIMMVLLHIPGYNNIFLFPINAIVTIMIDMIMIFIGNKILGSYAKLLGI